MVAQEGFFSVGKGEIQDMEKSLGFGVSFIMVLFLSGLSGYFLGNDVFQLTKTQVILSNRATYWQDFFL